MSHWRIWLGIIPLMVGTTTVALIEAHAEPEYKIEVATDQEVYPSSSTIYIEVRLHNLGDRYLTCYPNTQMIIAFKTPSGSARGDIFRGSCDLDTQIPPLFPPKSVTVLKAVKVPATKLQSLFPTYRGPWLVEGWATIGEVTLDLQGRTPQDVAAGVVSKSSSGGQASVWITP